RSRPFTTPRRRKMSTEPLKKLLHRGRELPQRLWEIMIVVALIPALVQAVASSLDAFPAQAAPAPTAPVPTEPARGVFGRDEPLDVDLYADLRALCRDPDRKDCADLPATLVYAEDGIEQSVQVALRTRGRFRTTTGGCDLPALF